MSTRIIDSYAIDGKGVILLIERVTSDQRTYGGSDFFQTDIDWRLVHERPSGDQDLISNFDTYRNTFAEVQAAFGRYIDEVLS